jgi:hypothetical protein
MHVLEYARALWKWILAKCYMHLVVEKVLPVIQFIIMFAAAAARNTEMRAGARGGGAPPPPREVTQD